MKKSIKYRRTSEVRLTNEARILRMIREERRLSIRKVAKELGYSETYLRHIEKGRLDIPSESFTRRILALYSVTLRQFKKRASGELKIDKRDECMNIINHIDDQSLDIVWKILQQFK